MSFYSRFKEKQIKPWEDFYWDYQTCIQILAPLKKEYRVKIKEEFNKATFTKTLERGEIDGNLLLKNLFAPSQGVKLEKIQQTLNTQIELELKKVEELYVTCFKGRITPRFQLIKNQLEYSRNDLIKYADTFEVGIKELYKELRLIKSFVEDNLECKEKVIAKYNKYSSVYHNDYSFSLESKVEEFFATLNLAKSAEDIQKLNTEIQQVFGYYFAPFYKDKCQSQLKSYVEAHKFNNAHTFYLGLFIGLLIFQLFCIGLIAYNYNLDIDLDEELTSVFPMFRAFFVVCLYWWVLGFNVYVWNKASISYKLIFQFRNHYSDVISIYKRAAIFSFILLSTVLMYMLDRANINILNGFFIPINILPLICWGSFLIYMFIPLKIFNYEGRTFMFDLIAESIVSFLLVPSFRDVWTIDQMTSLIGPLRDMEYTTCFYAYYNAPLAEKKIRCRNTRGVFLFIAYFPNIIRILQSSKMILDSKNPFPQKYNIVKYTLNLFVATFSFFLKKHWVIYPLWLITSFISTCFSFFWDIKMDFGLLSPDSMPLRKKLCYNSKFYYYMIAFFNFFLRFLWLVTLSPEVINTFIRPETLSIILFSLEIIRRGMWNCIRVEYKHIEISKEFRVTNDVDLPYEYKFGKLYPKEPELAVEMGLKRSDKIKLEIDKLFTDVNKSSNFQWENNFIEEDTRDNNKHKNPNHELRDFLASYQYNTLQNVSTNKSLNKLSRKI